VTPRVTSLRRVEEDVSFSPRDGGVTDDSIPFTESLHLAEAAGGRARLAILQTFHHTGPRPFWELARDRALDGWSVLRLVDDPLNTE
jgi:hypothetical protein